MDASDDPQLENERIPDVPTPANETQDRGNPPETSSEQRNREVLLANRATSPAATGSAGNSSSLEKLFQRMNVLSKEGKWNELASTVRSHEDLMIKRCGDLEQFIVTCDPVKHSAAVIFALNVLYDIAEKKNMSNQQERVFDILQNFLATKNYGRQQLLSIVDVYCQLFRKLHDYCISTKKYEFGYNITALGIDAISDKGDGLLTSLHSNLFVLALKSGQSVNAMGYLEDLKHILNENMVPQQMSSNYFSNTPHIDYKYALYYLYYGSEIAYKSGDVERAITLLYTLITFTATEVVPILITGHKKWFLYHLLMEKEPTPPSARAQCLTRAWRQDGEPYSKIYNAIKSADNPVVAVEAVVKEHEKVFEKDDTVELLNVLIASLVEKAVLKVAKCFSTITVQELIRRAYLKSENEAKDLIKKLSLEGKVVAQFENDVVHLEIPTRKINDVMVKNAIQRVEDVKKNLASVHCSVQCHPIFLSRTLRLTGPGYLDDEGLSINQ